MWVDALLTYALHAEVVGASEIDGWLSEIKANEWLSIFVTGHGMMTERNDSMPMRVREKIQTWAGVAALSPPPPPVLEGAMLEGAPAPALSGFVVPESGASPCAVMMGVRPSCRDCACDTPTLVLPLICMRMPLILLRVQRIREL